MSLFVLHRALEDSGVKTHSVVSRVKTLESVVDKTVRQGLDQPLDELVDLVGLRVVCLFRSDIQSIIAALDGPFQVDSVDDKVAGGSPSTFEYQSVHVLARLNPGLSGPLYDAVKAITLEIQLRTIPMDAWASISHYIAYKTEAAIPESLKRELNSLSAQFYVADTLFESLRERISAAKREAESHSKKASRQPVRVDLETLQVFLEERFPEHGEAESEAL